MNVIKLNATDSTNSFLRRLSISEDLEDFTIVTAQFQTEGRGQMGTIWQSQSHKNLTVSVFKRVGFLKLEQQFYISMAVSLAVSEVLKYYHLKQVKIKWPNDILSEQKKIAGILIENIIKNNQLKASIIGLGLNVNQTEFEHLPNASSMKELTGLTLTVDEVLHHFIKQLKHYFKMLKNKELNKIRNRYLETMFRMGRPSMFRYDSGEMFTGYIKGVTDSGQLQVLIEDNIVKEFDMKQVSLIY